MEEIKVTSLAEQFGREEMRARHLRYGDRSINGWETWLGNLYWHVSRYGDSTFRPLAVLAVLTGFAGLCYTALLGTAGGLREGFLVAMNIAVSPLFQLSPAYGREGQPTTEAYCASVDLWTASEARSGS